MSLYTQSIGRMSDWLNVWIKVDESQKQELWIKSAIAEENCELVRNKIFCANAGVEIKPSVINLINFGQVFIIVPWL